LRLSEDATWGDFTVYLKGEHPRAYAGGGALPSAVVAGMQVFGLSTTEFDYLFVPGTSMGLPEAEFPRSPFDDAAPKEVAKHIRRFVKTKFPTTKKKV
jgi:hypothetical protein